MYIKKIPVNEYNNRRKRDEKLRKFLRLILFQIPLVAWCVVIGAMCISDFIGGMAFALLTSVIMIPWLFFARWITETSRWN